MHSLSEYWQQRLIDRQQQHLHRTRRVLMTPQSTIVSVNGDQCVNFSSNDYLGFANHPSIVNALEQGAKRYGVGSGASHLVCGHSYEHHALEDELAEFTGRDRALLFSSGYMANVGVMHALLNKHTSVFQDKLNHASLLDGAALSAARSVRFNHNDIDHLTARLESDEAQHKVIAVDGVFSMDGDVADLSSICPLAREHNACVMVDDAHGFGCLGDTGRGTLEYHQLSQTDVPIYMGTLGKALGGFGAFVAGDSTMVDNLVQFARSYVYTTAMPPAMAAAMRASLTLLTTEAWRRDQLQEHIHYFTDTCRINDVPLVPSMTAIQPVLIGDSETAVLISQQLMEQGCLVVAIRPPTVLQGQARLRIALSAEHTVEQLDHLIHTLRDTCKRYGVLNREMSL